MRIQNRWALPLALIAAIGLALSRSRADPGAGRQAPGQAAVFKGENCASCHADIRDAKPLLPALLPVAEESFDAVVVGGGVAGLAAAYWLKDLKILVLEKEDRPGGHVRRESFANGQYPVAAVYILEPEGPIRQLLDELGIKPQPIREPSEMLAFEGRRISKWLSTGADDFPYEARKEMKKLSRDLAVFKEADIKFPVSKSAPKLLKAYEGVSFREYLLKHYGRTAAKLGDAYSKDMFGAGAAHVSAFMGLFFMIDDFYDQFCWEGGLGLVSERLAEALGPRLRTGATVVSVRQSKKGASVEYLQEGRRRAVNARAVVFATHMMVVDRIAQDISAAKREAIQKVQYSAYAVVPISFRETVWDKSFALWSPDTVFTDITFPDVGGPDGQVGIAYMPLGMADGRKYLLAASDEQIIGRVKRDLDKIIPGASKKIREARVIRWGHAMPVMGPNYFRDIQPALERAEGRYFFSGEDLQSPSLDGVIYSSFEAAKNARAFLNKN
ncbi:MAG: FAD-dependent oxidoreductase [Elusimicrobia bacterium]|nr:FAD-dependent oxidoreductase [Elusimicrobiota bacterium]